MKSLNNGTASILMVFSFFFPCVLRSSLVTDPLSPSWRKSNNACSLHIVPALAFYNVPRRTERVKILLKRAPITSSLFRPVSIFADFENILWIHHSLKVVLYHPLCKLFKNLWYFFPPFRLLFLSLIICINTIPPTKQIYNKLYKIYKNINNLTYIKLQKKKLQFFILLNEFLFKFLVNTNRNLTSNRLFIVRHFSV